MQQYNAKLIMVHKYLIIIMFSLAESPSPIGSGGDIETVELMKPEQGGLGLLIFETDDQPGVFIQEVVQNKAAYLDGRIRPGDRILAINGEKIYNAGQNYVVRLLQVYKEGGGCLSSTLFLSLSLSVSPPSPLSLSLFPSLPFLSLSSYLHSYYKHDPAYSNTLIAKTHYIVVCATPTIKKQCVVIDTYRRAGDE